MILTGNSCWKPPRRARHRYVRRHAEQSATHTAMVPSQVVPLNAFFSIDESRPRGGIQTTRTKSNSRCQSTDAVQDYFPCVLSDRSWAQTEPFDSRVQSRCESVPLPVVISENSDSHADGEADRSATAPPRVDSSLDIMDLSPDIDLEPLSMRPGDIATVAVEKEQETFCSERRLNISSAMGVRQHGSPRFETLSGMETRRKLLDRERSYLCMKLRERPCLRTESFLNDDLYSKVSNISRECCDVLGPKACYECDRLNRRSNSALRNEASFPSIHISAANFSTIALVNRVRPELNSKQVLEKLASGDICRQPLRRRGSPVIKQDAEEESEGPFARESNTSAFQDPNDLGFFTNMSELRAQLFARKQNEKRRGRSRRSFGHQGVANARNGLPAVTSVELVPKKECERENPANYFSPPMLSRAEIQRQKSHPRFYAGTAGRYELPEAPSFDEMTTKVTGSKRHHGTRHVETHSVDVSDSGGSLPSSQNNDDRTSPLDDDHIHTNGGTKQPHVQEITTVNQEANVTVADVANYLDIETDST